MSHHGKMLTSKEIEEHIAKSDIKPGATGKYPDGKMNDQDEGELRATISIHNDRIVIDFGKQVHWFAMTKNDAIGLIKTLGKYVDLL